MTKDDKIMIKEIFRILMMSVFYPQEKREIQRNYYRTVDRLDIWIEEESQNG